MDLTITLEEYEALVYFARNGTTDADKKREIEAFLQQIEKRNDIKRYFLWVQWQETDYPLPATTQFPTVWPPELRFSIERTDRPIARADVEKVLADQANRPVNILVTTDPGAELGWMAIDEYFKG
jgi:hypothetical protein